MGFRTARKLYQIEFETGHELHGLEIVCKSTTLGERLDYIENQPGDGSTAAERIRYEAEFFLKNVTDWNLEDENGERLPITYKAYHDAIPFEWHRPLIAAYVERMLGNKVSEGTEKKSGSGEPTETTPGTEASLPMETLP